MLLISVELFLMLCILLFVPGDYAGPCFIGFAIGESLGAAALRIAGGIFTKIADIGSDLMKIVFNIKEDDARNPGVIADCTGDNAGDSVGPSADGFETYGVTGVALITFILLAVRGEHGAGAAARVDLRHARHDDHRERPVVLPQRDVREGALRQRRQDELRGAADVARLAHVDRLGRHHVRRVVRARSPGLGDGTLWWKLSTIITCGTLAGALIPELVKVFTSTESGHVKEVVTASREGGPSLNILSGFVAGNFSAYWLGLSIVALMGMRVRRQPARRRRADAGAGRVRLRPRGVRVPRHGPGDDRGRFLRSGDRQRAVGVRAVGHRDAPRHQGEPEEGIRLRRELRRAPRICSRRTTAPATRSRPRPSPC